MLRRSLLFTGLAALLAACAGGIGGGNNTDVYLGYEQSGPINEFDSDSIQLRQLDAINAIRAEQGIAPLVLNANLTASALTHSRDIAVQQRAWNFGSDRSTPQSRAEQAGFDGIVTGENIAETYLGEFDVMQLWLSEELPRAVILNPETTDVGIAWFQQVNGKVWWVSDFGNRNQNHANSPLSAGPIISSDF